MLQDRIKKISEYFKSMEITNNVLIVKVQYKNRWGVFPSEDGEIKVCKSEEAVNEYFYYCDYMTTNLENLFNLIEETIEMNISAEMKVNLLSEKIDELKELFANESLEKLQTLYFDFKTEKKKTKKKVLKKVNEKTNIEDLTDSEVIENNEIELHEENSIVENENELC